jgi:hypothetical protein
LLSAITIGGQTKLIQPIDSSWAKIHIKELQFITTQFVELDAAKAEIEMSREQIGIYKRVMGDKDRAIALKSETIDLLKSQLEDQRPAWYNKFSWGFLSAVVIIVGLFVALQ